MPRFSNQLPAIWLALGFALISLAPAAARCSRHHTTRGRCGHAYGRVLSPVLQPSPNAKAPPLPRAGLTDRPVQPGQTPLPTYLPNNAPPVFAPQKLN